MQRMSQTGDNSIFAAGVAHHSVGGLLFVNIINERRPTLEAGPSLRYLAISRSALRDG